MGSPQFQQAADDYSDSRNDGSVIPPNALALQLNEGDIQSPPMRRLSEQYVYDRINQANSVNQEASAYGSFNGQNMVIGENSLQDNEDQFSFENINDEEVAQVNNAIE